MPKKSIKVTDGTFSLIESEVKNQLYFYREDGAPLGDVENMPLVLFSQYLVCRADEEELPKFYEAEFLCEISKDGKVIRLTVTEPNDPSVTEKPQQRHEPTFFERIQSFLRLHRKRGE